MKKLPNSHEYKNSEISEEEYLKLVLNNPQWYPPFHFKTKKKELSKIGDTSVIIDDIDMIAFMGGRIEALPFKDLPRTIPWGDNILESFTMDKRSYYRTNTGHFIKQYQSIEIVPTTQERFNLARSFLRSSLILSNTLGEHTAFSVFQKRIFEVPQAGLTRGSKGTLETRKTRLAEIQEKYKDGVK